MLEDQPPTYVPKAPYPERFNQPSRETQEKGKEKFAEKDKQTKEQTPMVDIGEKPYIPKAPFPQCLQNNENDDRVHALKQPPLIEEN